MIRKLLYVIFALTAIPALMSAQAQITTKKVKIEDFPEKVTKVVLSGNIFYDSTLKEEIRNRWVVSPYEFCSMEEFNELKTDPDYYFLIKVKGQFRKESEPGIEFLSLLKGGPEAEKGLDKMLDVITFPYAALDSPTGRETVFMPLILEIMQKHVLASIETDLVAYSSLSVYSNNIGQARGKHVLMAEEDLSDEITPAVKRVYMQNDGIEVASADSVDMYVTENVPGTVVSYTVCPEDPQPGSYCYKLLIDVEEGELYYFRKHRINRKTGPGFLLEDIKRIAEAVD